MMWYGYISICGVGVGSFSFWCGIIQKADGIVRVLSTQFPDMSDVGIAIRWEIWVVQEGESVNMDFKEKIYQERALTEDECVY